MTDMITWVIEHSAELIAILTGVVTVASAIAALTPTPKDDNIVGKVYGVIDWLALNVGKAKDKPSK
jgi:hypothetical protein|tara:strand:+ start:309 stop:506 length:198 start_codon:yes stop_codon:yes gene_type:complete